MPRKMRELTFEGEDAKSKKTYQVYELRVKQIIALMEDNTFGDDLSLLALKSFVESQLLPLCSNISMKELYDMYPSEIEECWNAFREVNASFFVGIKAMGLTSVMETVKQAIINDFSKMLVDSSKQVIPTS